MDRSEVAKRIRNLRIAKGLTQNKLATRAGVSPTYIYQLERGEKSPTIEYLDNICWGLDITLQEFFTPESPENSYTFTFPNLTQTQRELLVAFLKSL